MVRFGPFDLAPARVARNEVTATVTDLLAGVDADDALDLSPRPALDGARWCPPATEVPDGRFPLVVSVLRTLEEADVDCYVATLARVIDPDGGRLVFVEPTRNRGRWRRVALPMAELAGGCHLHVDFRLDLWRAGLTVHRVNRRSLPTRAWPIEAVAYGWARPTPWRADGTPPASVGA